MRALQVINDLKNYLSSSEGGGYDVEVVAPGKVTKGKKKVKLLYFLLGFETDRGLVSYYDKERVQLTVVIPENTAKGLNMLADMKDKIHDWIITKSYSNKSVYITGRGVDITYMADNFLPAFVVNFNVSVFKKTN